MSRVDDYDELGCDIEDHLKSADNYLRKLFQLVEQGMGKSEAGGEKVKGGWVAGLCMRGVTGAV